MAERLFRRAANQEGHWLDPERLRVYSLIFIAIYAFAAVAWVMMGDGLIDRTDKPLGYDFLAFWTASKLALAGDFQAVFDETRLFVAEHNVIPAEHSLYPWNYPLQYLLVVMPLALLPYVTSFFVWNGVWLAAFLYVVYRMAPWRVTLLIALAYPAAFWNLTHGQNGLLVAALLGGAILLLQRRPVLAGILIGLMSFKPHLGLLIPVALLFGGQWTAFASAAVTTVCFAAVSTLVFGLDAWGAFWNSLGAISAYVESGANPWPRMASLFTALRMLGVPSPAAYAAQIASALAAAAAVAWLWLRGGPFALRAAGLVAAIPLATPYVFDYDLAILAIPLALMARDGYLRGWLFAEREILALAWTTPLLATNLAAVSGVHIGYLCILALFLICLRRGFAPDGAFLRPGAAVRVGELAA